MNIKKLPSTNFYVTIKREDKLGKEIGLWRN